MSELSPEDVVRAVIVALEAGRWDDVLSLADRSAVARFVDERLERLRRLETAPSEDVETFARTGRISREDAVRYAAAAEARHRSEHATLVRALGGTAAELAERSSEDVFLRWLAGSALPERWPHDARDLNATPPPLPVVERTVLGFVPEGDGRAHVVYRERLGDDDAEGVLRITSLHRIPEGWRLLVDEHLLGFSDIWVVAEPQTGEG